MTMIALLDREVLWTGAEWTFADIERTYAAVEAIGRSELGLSCYPNQIEIISSEQMLDAYASIGMPVFYNHWSFGKHFSREWGRYKKGHSGLAYELVINSDPCINYLMDGNTMTTQALVLAHAAMGHNHFFRNNELFRHWTDAGSIVDYLVFARDYVAEQERIHGRAAVERFLDACHALRDYGIDRARRPSKLSAERERIRQRLRDDAETEQVSELDRILPGYGEQPAPSGPPPVLAEPEENLLYLIEKHAPDLEPWQRELVRITRRMAQYFYPQGQTKVMNEGFASFVHYAIMNRLHDQGLTTIGAHIEFLALHANVLFQPDFDDPRYSGINPYALGFAVFSDIARAASAPDAEDRAWLPTIAGCGDPLGAVREAAANYRDESFLRQYLSPKVMRRFRLFRLHDRADARAFEVTAIHDERGYADLRESIADDHEWHAHHPMLAAVDIEKTSRTLTIEYRPYRNRTLLDPKSAFTHLRTLWTRPVILRHATTGQTILS
jgi:spore cortex formation protein SpoVR/YcgB (stage V sporulation)